MKEERKMEDRGRVRGRGDDEGRRTERMQTEDGKNVKWCQSLKPRSVHKMQVELKFQVLSFSLDTNKSNYSHFTAVN